MNEGEDLSRQFSILSFMGGFVAGFFVAIFVCGIIVALTNVGIL